MGVPKGCVLLLSATLLLLLLGLSSSEAKDPVHTNVILIGATGDLAQKYLWRALFDLFSKRYVKDKSHFSIYACTRKGPESGRKTVSEILLSVSFCAQPDTKCRDVKRKFIEAVQYHRLRNATDYEALAAKINENTQSLYGLQGSPKCYEQGRLVYLSIPPSQYPKAAQLVHEHLRPKMGRPWFRVVIEKPFGHDFSSAQALSDDLSKCFTESEMYRIDHYLGKTIVKQILPFRYINKDTYEPLWNRHHIDRVEIVMKEKIDVTGRTKFYEEVGVVRDVMQNHLMELLNLVAMDLPTNSGNITDILRSKLQVLRTVQPLGESSIALGQFASYPKDYMVDRNKTGEFSTTTPTFAAAVLHLRSPRWHGVPFILVSGKKLDEKSSYIRLVFKNTKYCLRQNDASCHKAKPRQLVFHIGSGNMNTPPMISCSLGLPTPKSSDRWLAMDLRGDTEYFGESIEDTVQLVPQEDDDAYSMLLEAVFTGAKHMFVDTANLMASWKIWSPLLDAIRNKRPRAYVGGKIDPNSLDFQLKGNAIEFLQREEIESEVDDVVDFKKSTASRYSENQIPGSFRGKGLVSGESDNVVADLAKTMLEIANLAVGERGHFHLVLSGGNTPQKLLQHIVSNMMPFPWSQTHVWLVDERCVPLDDSQSNFNMVNAQLLEHVGIPFLNIHPMPVHITCEPCSEGDQADEIYESTMHRQSDDGVFDFLLLGVGEDGHTASLFPNQPSTDQTDKLVAYSDGGPVENSPRRMTLTLHALNQARNIGVLILGSKKHGIVEKLSALPLDEDHSKQYPITGVNPHSGPLVWYVDHEALFGEHH